MKTVIAAALLLVVAGAATAEARVNFNVNVDVPVVMAPVPSVAVATGYQGVPAQMVNWRGYSDVAEPPRFIYSPDLGFHVSVGTPYDMVYLDNGYYLYRGGYWYASPSFRGPWATVSQRRLPQGLRVHRYEQVRHFRDHEYGSYLRDRDHYRGTWYRPGDRRVEDRRDNHYDGRRDDRRDGRRDGR